jgi:hypothetical protein
MNKHLNHDPLPSIVKSITKQHLLLILIANCETSMADLALPCWIYRINKATKHTVLLYYILNHRTFLEARRIAERNVLRSSSYVPPTTCAQLKKRHYFIRAGAHAETLIYLGKWSAFGGERVFVAISRRKIRLEGAVMINFFGLNARWRADGDPRARCSSTRPFFKLKHMEPERDADAAAILLYVCRWRPELDRLEIQSPADLTIWCRCRHRPTS